ncbi:MAG: hypothetical protein QOE92_2549 [Chloroflexota bacterium]|jgi:hypothetical protein|nr:hypothetical protein [Chloroflexota bacterium]
MARARSDPAKKAQRQARKAGRDVRKAAANPWLERAARLGYVIRGLLYGGMGALAIGLVVGGGTQPKDMKGLLFVVAASPFRLLLLAVVVVGLGSYSLWGFVRAVYDPLHRGDDPMGVVARLGFAWSGVNYAALAILALGFIANRPQEETNPVQDAVRVMLSAPAGRLVTIAAGLIGIAAGFGQFFDGISAGFRNDLKRNQMTAGERVIIDGLGRMGMIARGVIFTMLGWFVVVAGLQQDPGRAEGIGNAFATLAAAPLGQVTMTLVALGFIALGLHSFACARWMRMLQPR